VPLTQWAFGSDRLGPFVPKDFEGKAQLGPVKLVPSEWIEWLLEEEPAFHPRTQQNLV
jgi:hypothetical protein